MFVSTLDVRHFRNLRQVSMQCSPRVNLVFGKNASGKTSLLEALYFLGRGRSFRTRHVRFLIQHEATAFRIVATMAERLNGRAIPVGIQRSARETIARIDGKPVQTLARLAAQVPILLLNPGSHRLLEGGPQYRRRFMDWGLFHTEQSFLVAWKRFTVALRNRNAALRSPVPARTIDAWDRELALASDTLDRLRETFCKALEGVLEPLVTDTLGQVSLQVEYRRGWPQEPNQELLDLLRRARDRDRRQGYTRWGPQRADFQIKIDGWPAAEYLSRGQQKLFVTALMLAQARLYEERTGNACILLIDDLPAELDRIHRTRVLDCLAAMNTQLFITAIEEDLLDISGWRDPNRFRITHGYIHKMV